MIQAVIFDLYGVLALNGWQSFKVKHFTSQPEKWRALYALGQQVDAGKASYDDLVRFTAQASGEPQVAVKHELEHTVANQQLLTYIGNSLHGIYKLGILSNSSDDVITNIFTKQQLAMFDAVLLSHHVGLTKPDVRMYHAVARKLGIAPQNCLFIDDQERHCQGAKTAGMQALLFSDLTAFKRDFASVVHE